MLMDPLSPFQILGCDQLNGPADVALGEDPIQFSCLRAYFHGRRPGLEFGGGRKIVTPKSSDPNFAMTFLKKKFQFSTQKF